MKPAAFSMMAGFRSLPGPFWVLWGGTFINRFATFVMPFLTLFMKRQGFTAPEAGYAVLAYGTGGFICSFIAGPLADMLGRNRVLAGALGLEAVMVFFLGRQSTFAGITALCFLAGLAGQGVSPAVNGLVGDIVPADRRLQAQLALRLAVNAGFAFGPAVAGFVAVHSYGVLFTVDALTSLTFACMALFFLPQGQTTARKHAGWRPALTALRHSRGMWSVLAAAVCCSFLFRQITTTLNLEVLQRGHAESTAGMLLSMNGLLIICLEIPLMAATSWLSLRAGMGAGVALMGLSLMLNALHGPVWMLFVCMAGFTLGEMITLPRQATLVVELSPPDMRARFAGFTGFAWVIGNMSGALAGINLHAWNPVVMWCLCGLLGAVAAAIIVFGHRDDRTVVPAGKAAPAGSDAVSAG
ncbi:MAG: putative major facilitator superfamily transporter [Verrucomicrobiales bacterium]|nr:putative major facilitator superfamily transporter [Verrucomicrobiales bacterium]